MNKNRSLANEILLVWTIDWLQQGKTEHGTITIYIQFGLETIHHVCVWCISVFCAIPKDMHFLFTHNNNTVMITFRSKVSVMSFHARGQLTFRLEHHDPFTRKSCFILTKKLVTRWQQNCVHRSWIITVIYFLSPCWPFVY